MSFAILFERAIMLTPTPCAALWPRVFPARRNFAFSGAMAGYFWSQGPAAKYGLARRDREAHGHVGHCGNDLTMGLICQVRTVAGACLAGA